jgi:hypothetical protein
MPDRAGPKRELVRNETRGGMEQHDIERGGAPKPIEVFEAWR